MATPLSPSLLAISNEACNTIAPMLCCSAFISPLHSSASATHCTLGVKQALRLPAGILKQASTAGILKQALPSSKHSPCLQASLHSPLPSHPYTLLSHEATDITDLLPSLQPTAVPPPSSQTQQHTPHTSPLTPAALPQPLIQPSQPSAPTHPSTTHCKTSL